MKRTIIKVFSITVLLVTVMSLMSVSAAGKLSEYDFSKWNQVGTQKIDFENYNKDDAFKADNKPQGWSVTQAALGPSKIAEASGSKYLAVDGYFQMFAENAVDKFYSFSADLSSSGDKNMGMFVRAGSERIALEANGSDFFEQDRGDKNGGVLGIGATGFYLKPNGTKIKLFVKLFDAAQLCKVNNVVYEFDAGVDFAAGLHKVTMIDDGSSVSIYVADNFIAKVAFSESKVYDLGKDNYYSKAVITKADGSEVATLTNAMISTKSVVAIGVRNTQVSVDNIVLTQYEAKSVNPQTGDAGLVSVFAIVVIVSFVAIVFKKRVIA